MRALGTIDDLTNLQTQNSFEKTLYLKVAAEFERATGMKFPNPSTKEAKPIIDCLMRISNEAYITGLCMAGAIADDKIKIVAETSKREISLGYRINTILRGVEKKSISTIIAEIGELKKYVDEKFGKSE